MTTLEETLQKTEKKKHRLNFLKRGHIEGTAFRVKCLLIRVEQQHQNTTNIIKKMQENGVQKAQISRVGKVMREVLHLRHQLFRILDNDPVTLVQIGDAEDLEEFFLYVADICSAAERIKFVERKKESAEKQNLRLLEMLKDGKEQKGTKLQSQSSIIGQAFRVRCLLIRVEQQLMHTTNIIKKMQQNGVQRARIRLIGKVMRDVLQLRYQLLRIIDYDPVTLVQIGDEEDLEEFFLYVEDICSAAEEIKFDEPPKGRTLKNESAEKKRLRVLESLKGGKEKRGKSQSQLSIIDQAFRGRNLLTRVEQQLQHTTNIIKKMQQNGVQRARISHVGKVMRDVLNLRRQLLRILDNDPVTLVQIGDAEDLEEFFLYVEDICSPPEEIEIDEPKKEDTLREEYAGKKRLGLLQRPKDGEEKKGKKSLSQVFIEGQAEKTQDDDGQATISNNDDNHLKHQYQSGLVKDWSDPDTDDEMYMFQGHDPSDRQKYKWPLPNTTTKARIEKEKQLHTLMTEIGGLMQEVALVDKKTKQTGLTNEALMGSCEKHVCTDVKVAKKARKSQNPSTKTGKFDEELDKLLAECDAAT